ncbi:carbon-nitrogen hydrolase family protein [Pokkaliibacter sp. MBI-7]|uniref:carbon-nitrogen hydrolase family protein n=1 Tax=Pokkaliibacter sp. MBI-7 TaxID=3040600 RepID=UPI00244CF63D|nr:carbon-nitrogen hydrolase family protein [Pokkaliibacter sp. MBI-7]MDH2431672.1 carbon-nitrogen hydrolase family protein [Pokkaliibacter sp. MBI-7]
MGEIALVQMVSIPDLDANLQQAQLLIEVAAKQGARFILLPENFASFSTGRMQEVAAQEIDQSGRLRSFVAEQARRHGIWLLAGTIPTRRRADGSLLQARARSASWLLDDAGNEVARYDKIHLFDVEVADQQQSYRESSEVEPGDTPVVADTPWGRLGMAVCYDLRFPELFRRYQQAGAELISLPSAFTRTTGDAHWEVLVRARAIETQCYMLAPNMGGQHTPKRATNGDSMIVSPWGEVLNRLKQGGGVVSADCDLQLLRDIRTRMPVLQHVKLAPPSSAS